MSTNRIKDALIFLCIAVLFWLVLSGNNKQKIAYINVQYVFENFQLKKELQSKYHNEMASRKRMTDSLGFDVQRMGIELEAEKKPDQAKMNVYLMKRKQYFEMVKAYEEEDKKMNSEYDSQILSQMNQYVKEYGEENGYDMVFGSLGSGNIMHASDAMDITKEVTQYINDKYAGKK